MSRSLERIRLLQERVSDLDAANLNVWGRFHAVSRERDELAADVTKLQAIVDAALAELEWTRKERDRFRSIAERSA